jgi:hypothetical protein
MVYTSCLVKSKTKTLKKNPLPDDYQNQLARFRALQKFRACIRMLGYDPAEIERLGEELAKRNLV